MRSKRNALPNYVLAIISSFGFAGWVFLLLKTKSIEHAVLFAIGIYGFAFMVAFSSKYQAHQGVDMNKLAAMPINWNEQFIFTAIYYLMFLLPGYFLF